MTVWGRIAAWVLRHPRLATVLLFLTVTASVFAGVPPELEPSLLALMPQDDPTIAAMRELHDQEGGVGLVTLSFDGPEDDVEAVLDELSTILSERERVRYVLHDLDPDLMTRLGLLQFEAEAVEGFTQRLRGALALGPALNPVIAQRMLGPAAEELWPEDAAALLEAITRRDRLWVRPTTSYYDRAFARALVDEIDVVLDDVLARHPTVTLAWFGGAYRHLVDDYDNTLRDVTWTSAVSLGLVLLVLTVAFRAPRVVLLMAVPLVGALTVTLGITQLLLGSLNTHTSMSLAILVGLGIDFAVHLLARYRELRADGLQQPDAICLAWDRAGPPCATAALTSAGGFLSLSIATYQGFAQLGVVLAIGVLVALVMMAVALPLLLPYLDPAAPASLRGGVASRLTKPARSAPWLLVGLLVATGLAGTAFLPRLHWQYDTSLMGHEGRAYDELDEAHRAHVQSSFTPAVVQFDREADLEAAQAQIRARRAEGGLPHVAGTLSVTALLPDDQAARLAALTELQALLHHPHARRLPPAILASLAPLRSVSLEPLTPADLPLALRSLLGLDREETHRMVVFPRGNMWDLRVAAAFGQDLEEVLDGRPVAAEYVAVGALYGYLLRDVPRVGLLGLVLVTLVAAVDLRRPWKVAATVGALLAGMTWAGAAIYGLGISLNMVNVIGLPILLGIGVDVVIHLLHRLDQEGPGGIRRAFVTTGGAAAISATTTMAAFFSLNFAASRGVRSLGQLAVVGLFVVFVVGATFVTLARASAWLPSRPRES